MGVSLAGHPFLLLLFVNQSNEVEIKVRFGIFLHKQHPVQK